MNTREALARLRDEDADAIPDDIDVWLVRIDDLRLALSLLDRAREVLGPFADDAAGLEPFWADERTYYGGTRCGELRAAAALHAELSE